MLCTRYPYCTVLKLFILTLVHDDDGGGGMAWHDAVMAAQNAENVSFLIALRLIVTAIVRSTLGIVPQADPIRCLEDETTESCQQIVS